MRVCLHDRERIAACLQRQADLQLYLLGDLDGFFWPHTTWYGWLQADQLTAVALLYSGDELPVLLALGEGQAPLLQQLEALLPGRFYCHLSPGLEDVLGAYRRLSGGERHYRMVLSDAAKGADLGCEQAEVLSEADLPALEALYRQAYPHNWFNPRMLATGQYLGLREAGELLAVAGVHVYAPERGVAALGNITVHPHWRSRGWGARLTAELCRRLAPTTPLIGLNVHADNAPALRCYVRLGFEIRGEYREWMAQ